MSSERNYRIKAPSNQVRQYSTQSPVLCASTQNVQPKGLNPWLITGFIDAEGSFIISIVKDPNIRTGWNILVKFKISLHKKDLSILAGLKSYFGDIGKIDGTGRDRESLSYFISSRKLITAVVLPHLDRYPLKTQKQADYELFKQIILKMNNKEHLTNQGLQEIVNLRASLNLGLSEELKVAFPCTVPVPRPRVSLIDFKEHTAELPWISGFVSGEGCFSVVVSKSSTSKLGFNVRLRFILSQHSRDVQLMENLVNYFACGKCEKSKDGMIYYRITDFADNYDKVKPFFSKYELVGVKAQDFKDWCKVADIIKVKAHLTKEGLDQIIMLKAGMNRSRHEEE